MTAIDATAPRDVPWWQHESLTAGHLFLEMDGVPLAELAQQQGTPLYVYSRATIQRQLHRLLATLASTTEHFAVFYAMKANRFPGVLQAVRDVPGAGVDTCSPREVDAALAAGFPPELISFNAGMLSSRDLAHVAASTRPTISGRRTTLCPPWPRATYWGFCLPAPTVPAWPAITACADR